MEDADRLRRRSTIAAPGFLLTDPRLDDHPIVYANQLVPGRSPATRRTRCSARNCRFLQGDGAPTRRAIDELRRAIAEERAVDRRAAQLPQGRHAVPATRSHIAPVRDAGGEVVPLRRRPGRRARRLPPSSPSGARDVPGRRRPAAGRLAGPALDAGLARRGCRSRSSATSASSTRSASTRSAGSPSRPSTPTSSGACATLPSRLSGRAERPPRARRRERARRDPPGAGARSSDHGRVGARRPHGRDDRAAEGARGGSSAPSCSRRCDPAPVRPGRTCCWPRTSRCRAALALDNARLYEDLGDGRALAPGRRCSRSGCRTLDGHRARRALTARPATAA